MILIRTTVVLFGLLFLVPFTVVEAQSAVSNVLTEIKIEANPEFPRPGQTVQLSLNDYGSNTFGSEVNWYLDGEPVPAAQNQRNAQVVAGKAGETQTIEVELRTPTGGTIRLAQELTPIFLDIIIEPQTHVPAFYSGRALPSFGSMVNVTALVDGGNLDPNTLMYTWRINRNVVEGGSLRGGYKVDFMVPQGDFFTLALEIIRPTGQVVARRAYDIASVKPQLEFYEFNDVFGLSDSTIGSTYIPTRVTNTLQAAPYYLDINIYNQPDILEWKIDGQQVTTGTNPYQLTFSRQFSRGRSQIDFHVRSRTQLLQGVRDSVSITY